MILAGIMRGLVKKSIIIIDLNKIWPIIGLIMVGGVFLLVSAKIVYSQKYVDTDFFSFWLAGYSLLHGEDPYSTVWWISAHDAFGAEWISDETFLYPLPLAIFFIPFGLLPLDKAYVLWIVLSQFMILFAVMLLLIRANWQGHKQYLLPILAGVFLFRPVIVTLINGQLGALFLLILVILIILWENQHWLYGGLLLPVLVLKPSLGLFIGGLLGVWLIFQMKWKALVGVIVSSLGLCLVGWLYNPNWIQDFLRIRSGKLEQTFGYSPTIWGISGQLCSSKIRCTVTVGFLFVCLCLLAMIWGEGAQILKFFLNTVGK